MAYNLTANLTIQNAARLDLANVDQLRSVRGDPTTVYEAHVTLELRAGNSGTTPSAKYGEYILVIHNGPSDVIRVRTAGEWVSGSSIDERLIVVRNGVSTPTGLTTFLAALGAGNTNGLLNAALTSLKTLGVIDQTTLAGTAP